MNMYEVPKSEWPFFFDQFSRMHQGQLIDMETRDGAVQCPDRSCANARGIPLLGITAEAVPPDQAAKLDISAGDPSGITIGHTIRHPSRVRVSEWNDGVSASIEVESDDGRLTRVRVGPSGQMLPPGFIVDGI